MATDICATCGAQSYKNGKHPCAWGTGCKCWRGEPCKKGQKLAAKQGNSWMAVK